MITDGGLKTSWYNRLGGKAAIDITPIEGIENIRSYSTDI